MRKDVLPVEKEKSDRRKTPHRYSRVRPTKGDSQEKCTDNGNFGGGEESKKWKSPVGAEGPYGHQIAPGAGLGKRLTPREQKGNTPERTGKRAVYSERRARVLWRGDKGNRRQRNK